jgi:ATP synthase protein I
MNRAPGYPETDNNEDEDFKLLTAEAARSIEQSSPRISVRKLLHWQLVAIVVLAVLAWLVTGGQAACWSVVYGGLAVMLPAVLFMKGVDILRAAGSGDAGLMLVLFMLCEFGKLILAAVLLFLAPRLLGAQLDWIALLVGVIVTLKTYWVALWVQLRSCNRTIVEKS